MIVAQPLAWVGLLVLFVAQALRVVWVSVKEDLLVWFVLQAQRVLWVFEQGDLLVWFVVQGLRERRLLFVRFFVPERLPFVLVW